MAALPTVDTSIDTFIHLQLFWYLSTWALAVEVPLDSVALEGRPVAVHAQNLCLPLQHYMYTSQGHMAHQWPSRPHTWPTQLYWLGQFGTVAANFVALAHVISFWHKLTYAMSQIGPLAIFLSKILT